MKKYEPCFLFSRIVRSFELTLRRDQGDDGDRRAFLSFEDIDNLFAQADHIFRSRERPYVPRLLRTFTSGSDSIQITDCALDASRVICLSAVCVGWRRIIKHRTTGEKLLDLPRLVRCANTQCIFVQVLQDNEITFVVPGSVKLFGLLSFCELCATGVPPLSSEKGCVCVHPDSKLRVLGELTFQLRCDFRRETMSIVWL